MTNTRSALAIAVGTIVVALALPALSAHAQETPPSPPAPPEPTATASAASMGGCDTTGLSLSQPWIPRDSQLQWWAWGFAYGSPVGVQLIDPTGKTTSLGSLAVDGLCEAAGVVTADNRAAGAYTLVVTGQRPGGAANTVSVTFHIVSVSRPSSGASISPPGPSPTPTTAPPCQAVAAPLCP